MTPFPASKLPTWVPLEKGAPRAPATAPSAKAGSEPLPAEIVQAPAAATGGDGGFDARWLALPALAIVVAIGLVAARRRRGRRPGASAARTTA